MQCDLALFSERLAAEKESIEFGQRAAWGRMLLGADKVEWREPCHDTTQRGGSGGGEEGCGGRGENFFCMYMSSLPSKLILLLAAMRIILEITLLVLRVVQPATFKF